MKVEITSYKEMNQPKLAAFVSVLLNNLIEINDIAMRVDDKGQLWAALPSRAYEDREGNKKYAPIVRFPGKEQYREFQQLVVKAMEARDDKPEDQDNVPF